MAGVLCWWAGRSGLDLSAYRGYFDSTHSCRKQPLKPMAHLQSIKQHEVAQLCSMPDFLSLAEPSQSMDLLGLMDMSKTWEGVLMYSQTAFQCCWAASSTSTGFFPPFPRRVYLPCSLDISPAASGSQRAVTGVDKYGRINPLYFCVLHPSNL